jgi:flagellar hook protein FlgE
MSLFGSLFSGVSGLTAQSQAMGMISDNVSNVNTTAYKGAAPEFSTLVTRSARSATYSPGGVRATTHFDIVGQGLIQSDGSPTAVAIDGAGFFIVNGLDDGTGQEFYTRAGDFAPDFVGNMVNSSGFYLKGWPLDRDGNIADLNNLEIVNVRQINGLAAATTRVEMGANLDAEQAAFVGAYAAGDMAEFIATDGLSGAQPHFSREIQVFDSLGRPQTITFAAIKNATANTWDVELIADPNAIEPASHPDDGLIASGQIIFTGDGSLLSADLTPVRPALAPAGTPPTIDWLDVDGAIDSEITFDFGDVDGFNGFTQFDSLFDVAFVAQNGAEVGEMNGVSIDADGQVIVSFTNGQTRELYKLPIATFSNPSGLDPRTGNVYAQTEISGVVNMRESGRGGAGKVTPSALEGANVDLADEFTKMIVTQRAYSANAKIITTTDEMLDELIRISR